LRLKGFLIAADFLDFGLRRLLLMAAIGEDWRAVLLEHELENFQSNYLYMEFWARRTGKDPSHLRFFSSDHLHSDRAAVYPI